MGKFHCKWWFSIVMLVLPEGNSPKYPINILWCSWEDDFFESLRINSSSSLDISAGGCRGWLGRSTKIHLEWQVQGLRWFRTVRFWNAEESHWRPWHRVCNPSCSSCSYCKFDLICRVEQHETTVDTQPKRSCRLMQRWGGMTWHEAMGNRCVCIGSQVPMRRQERRENSGFGRYQMTKWSETSQRLFFLEILGRQILDDFGWFWIIWINLFQSQPLGGIRNPLIRFSYPFLGTRSAGSPCADERHLTCDDQAGRPWFHSLGSWGSPVDLHKVRDWFRLHICTSGTALGMKFLLMEVRCVGLHGVWKKEILCHDSRLSQRVFRGCMHPCCIQSVSKYQKVFAGVNPANSKCTL